MNKNVFVVGFMLFAIFFGAGNLIFPPKLGAEVGLDFWPAIFGFVITGVGLPLLGIVVAVFYKGGYKDALKQVHPWFALAYLIGIYLSIGPFFGGPRTAATAYEIAAVPFLGEASDLSLFIFCSIYFAIALWLSLNPNKLVDRIGSVLTPLLLVSLIALIVKSFMLLNGEPSVAVEKPISDPLFTGILEGYFTLDALASVAFAVLVINAIKGKETPASSLQKQTIYAGIIAAVALALIYVSLGWIGNHLTLEHNADQNLGTQILNAAATLSFGELGRMMLGLIVTLACLTTTVGLATSVSEYFNEIYPRISYKTYVVIFTVVSFGVANVGLNAVISKSVSVLLILYPISITMILMLLVNLFFRLPIVCFRFALGLITVESIISVLGKGYMDDILNQFPLKEYSMEWVPVMLIGIALGYAWRMVRAPKIQQHIEKA